MVAKKNLLNSYEAFRMTGESNLPTLFEGDHIIVKKKFYDDNAVERFDLVVYTQTDSPETELDESKNRSIKRVIGLPGDQIEVKQAKVFVNGSPINIDYGIWLDGGTAPSGPYLVPDESYFLLGDNRDRSKDSRHYHNPFIPKKNILGKLAYVHFNLNNPERIGTYIE